jgi:regulator of sirC expression with transglutaminase-like and TPR domain
MDPTARFDALVRGPEPAIPLDELALLVGAHAEPGLDVSRWLTELDDIASRCSDRSFAGLARHMVIEGFSGNRSDYYDARNSYLHDVLNRRVGIPITLSIVMMELGRRIDVPVVGIGLPGHFVVRDANDVNAFADPFEGQLLDRAGCELLLAGAQADLLFDEEFLAPVGTRAIVARLLANLKGIHLAQRNRRDLAWVLRLRVAVPGVPAEERRELASALAADGRFLEAAEVLDELVAIAHAEGDAASAEEAERGATRLRARLN